MKKLVSQVVLVIGVCLLFSFNLPSPKKIFVIGDSISFFYSKYLDQMLAGSFQVSRKEEDGTTIKNLDLPQGTNLGNSRMVLKYLRLKLKDKDFRPDYVLLNCGLHDIKRDSATNEIAIDTGEYRQNLKDIYAGLHEKKIRLIWIRTTAVVDSIHLKNKHFNRYAVDLERYNKIADEVFQQVKVPEIDLYTFTIKLGGNRYIDHVHYNEETRVLQAAYVAGFLQQYSAR